MELKKYFLKQKTHRLVRSVFPPQGILDSISSSEDLELISILEGWTNDRLSSELGNIFFLPKEDWVIGKENASVIMAAFCHPNPQGGRFNNSNLGAWYAAFELDTAFKEVAYHAKREFEEVQKYSPIQYREYLADFKDEFVDIRFNKWMELDIYDAHSYDSSQSFAQQLRDDGAIGLLYNSVRANGQNAVVCFKPKRILNVHQARHFEIRWSVDREPIIIESHC